MIEKSSRHSLAIDRPVLNIGEPEITAIQEQLTDGHGTPVGGKRLQEKVLAPARLAKMELISGFEVRRLLRYVGLRAVSVGHIEELAEHMDAALSDATSDTLTPATLPHEDQPIGEGRILTIAHSSHALRDRVKAKELLVGYYDAGELPSDFWFDDDLATSVSFARAYKPKENWLVDHIGGVIRRHPAILPDQTELGAVAARPLLPKNS